VFPEFDSFHPTLENFPSSLSGAQLWKGAAEILNKNPAKIKKNPIPIPLTSEKLVLE
jgi:hypothetical protein